MKQKWLATVPGMLVLALIYLESSLHAHVVPQDELRNQVYLGKTEALKSVFQGVRKLKHRKGYLTDIQAKQIQELTGNPPATNRVDFYYGTGPGGKGLFAFIETAESNSHPPSKAVAIVLVDAKGAVRDVKIMEYQGPQRAEIISTGFLNQFIGKTAESDFSTVTSNQGRTLPVLSLIQAVSHAAAKVRVLTSNP